MNTEATKTIRPNYLPTAGKLLAVLLLILDLAGLYLFWVVAQCLFNQSSTFSWLIPSTKLWPYFFLLVFFYIFELYKVNLQISGLRSAPRTFVAAITACILIVFFNAINPLATPMPLKIIAINFGLFSLWASLWRYVVAVVSEARIEKIRWLVIDPENIFANIYPQFVKKHSNQNFNILTDSTDFECNDFLKHLGNLDSLADIKTQSWSGVVITNPKLLSNEQTETLLNMRMSGIRVYNLHQFYEQYLYKIPVTHLEKDWFTVAQGFDLLHNPIGLKFKRITDLVLSMFLLILMIPVIFLVMLVVKLTSRGPIFFTQVRTGENGTTFKLYKFRSMKQDAEKHGAQWATQNDPRITRIGKFLRKSRLDELPQLWNVFKGDMSFIGPRPERPVFNRELEKVIPFFNLRHLVKPGITGWAQVLYPYGASVEDAKEKVEYDLYYIKNYSVFLDFSISLKTLRVIFLGKGR